RGFQEVTHGAEIRRQYPAKHCLNCGRATCARPSLDTVALCDVFFFHHCGNRETASFSSIAGPKKAVGIEGVRRAAFSRDAMFACAVSKADRIEVDFGSASRMNASPKSVRSRSLLHPKELRSGDAAATTIDRSSRRYGMNAPAWQAEMITTRHRIPASSSAVFRSFPVSS